MEIPGFIDLQVNGYKGVDFSSPQLTEEQLRKTCRDLHKSGTAAFLPTLITSPKEVYRKNLAIITKVISEPEFENQILGIHLEGPFISQQFGAVGAHNAEFVCRPSISYLDQLCEFSGGHIKMLTIAAEAEGAEDLAEYAVEKGIAVSLGHQLATEEQINKLTESGATALTHLGNALPNQIERHNNPLWPALANDKLTAMIITDGHHIPDSMIITTIKAKGIGKVAVVSDSAPIAGLGPGRYKTLGRDVVLDETGLLYCEQTKSMAGSSANMTECMNYLAGLNILSLDELIELGFYTPLRLIGLKPDAIGGTTGICWDAERKIFKIKT